VGEDAHFNLSEDAFENSAVLIAMFDRIETPPVIVPDYDPKRHRDVPIPVEYACVPGGYPEEWDAKYKLRGKDFHQTIVPKGSQLYGVMFFDGPKFAEWGNKINVGVHRDSPDGELIMVTEAGEGPAEHVNATHSDHAFPRIDPPRAWGSRSPHTA
jgi:hypothetical protein